MPKSVVVGVSGGIAAYKSAYLTSLLKKKGYDVHVILTENALKFVTALTFETLSENPVVTDTFERTEEFDVKHISLAKKADMFIVAPATANIIGKVASGVADDILTTTLLAARCPVVFAPAMNEAMYTNPSVIENITTLRNRGIHVMDTGEGILACGDIGQGRMKAPEEIAEYIENVFSSLYDMHGVKVLISAGPTREMVDPVRFLSNRSSGKMGYAIARAAIDRGADVTLVSGPVALEPPMKAKLVNVISASEMAENMMQLYRDADIIIMAAAVSDYTPENFSKQKIKKCGNISLELVRTADILKQLGEKKIKGKILMGFAAETCNTEKNALSKLKSKNLDIIALNDVSKEGEGFASDDNNIKLFFSNGETIDLGSENKEYLAKQIIWHTYELYRKIHSSR